LGADAVLLVLVVIGLAALAGQLRGLLLGRFHTAALFSIGAPEIIVSASPVVTAIGSAARAVLTYGAVLALAFYMFARLRSRWMVVALLAAALVATIPVGARTAGEFALGAAAGAPALAAVALFALGFARHNWLAYALGAWTIALRGATIDLFGQPNNALQVQGWTLVAVLAASLLWCGLPALRQPAPIERD